MSLRIYLDIETLEKKKIATKSGKKFKHGDIYRISGLNINHDSDRDEWYLPLYRPGALLDSIPAKVANAVTEVSFRDQFSMYPERMRGIYKSDTATAELTERRGGGDYELIVKGENLDDVSELAFRIRAGKVAPDISFEKEQTTSRVISKITLLWTRLKERISSLSGKLKGHAAT